MKFLTSLFVFLFPTATLRNSRTVHYAFSFLFLFAAIVGMAAVATHDMSTIRIVSSEQSVERGKVFSIDVLVNANTPVNAVTITLRFPHDQVEVLGIDRGESVLTLWTGDPKVENGTVFLEGGTYKKGFIGEHKIATINLRALKSGKATFATGEIKLLAGDGKGTVVPTNTAAGTLSTAIFEPGTNPTSLVATGAVVVVTDLDGDGTVSLRDISSFMASWSGGGAVYDFNSDGKMTFRDFSIILSDFFTKGS